MAITVQSVPSVQSPLSTGETGPKKDCAVPTVHEGICVQSPLSTGESGPKKDE